MKIEFDGEGYNGTSTIAQVIITDLPSDFLSLTGMNVKIGSSLLPLSVLSSVVNNGIIDVVLGYPTLTTSNYDYQNYPNGGVFDVQIEYMNTSHGIKQTNIHTAFMITKYADPHRLRTIFSIDADEVNLFILYNAIQHTRSFVDDALSSYVTSGSIGWDIGDIPIPIAQLHEYYVAWTLMSNMHPTKFDKADTMQTKYEGMLKAILSGKLVVDNITPEAMFKSIDAVTPTWQ